MTTTIAPPVTTDRDRSIGRLAWYAAWFGLGFGQLHALARHATEDGRSDLESGLVRAWSEPASELLSPLLTWASPDVVYLTYGKLWLPVFLAFTLAAFVSFRRRRPTGFEKGVWRVVLTSYVLASACVGAEYWTQWTGMNEPLLEGVFLATMPVLLVMMLSTCVLGATLLRRRFRPLLPALLLALALPGVFAISAVTSLGNVVLPIAFAFGILGRRF